MDKKSPTLRAPQTLRCLCDLASFLFFDRMPFAGKEKAYTALLQCRTFLCPKNGSYRGKISGVDMVFLVFIGFLYPSPAWKVFL